MLKFQIQSDSDIPASQQLFEQIQFEIASGQYPHGHRLPSTRQLATMTGLHRNTISKVYQQLEEAGLVKSVAGSGIYVQAQGYESIADEKFPVVGQNNLVKECIDELLDLGCTLTQIKELFLTEIDWRLRCRELVIVTVPTRDLKAGELMRQQLEHSLSIPVQLICLEELSSILQPNKFGTVITSRYFIKEVLEVVRSKSFRVFPVDIYDYAKELKLIAKLPQNACLGLVSLSEGTLTVAERIVNTQRGDEILVLTAPVGDRQRLKAIIRRAQMIISDPASYGAIEQAIAEVREDLMRRPQIICSENYISEKSINSLKRELDLP
jgi:GntR family transcriptional regulator